MQQGVAIAPVVVETFHPVHELQAFALVVVAGSKLDGQRVLGIAQLDAADFVECRCQDDTSVVLMTCQYLCLSDEQLCQHDAWQRFLLILAGLAHPVDAIESAEQHDTVLACQDGSHVELVALQTVVDAVVVESVVEGAVLIVTLDDDAADAVAGRYPDVMTVVFGDAADGVVAEPVFLSQVVELVVLQVQDVHAFTGSHPQQSAGVFKNLCDVVVGECREVGGVTCEHHLLACREIEDDQSLRRTDEHVVVLAVVECSDGVGVQHTVLTGVRRE